MSRCSTNAFKVPKGMCSCSMPGAPDELDGVIEHLDELLSEDEFPCDECRAEHEQLRGWLDYLKSLAQCHLQLEQVARGMLLDICVSAKYHMSITDEAFVQHKEQLEALGVSLDD